MELGFMFMNEVYEIYRIVCTGSVNSFVSVCEDTLLACLCL